MGPSVCRKNMSVLKTGKTKRNKQYANNLKVGLKTGKTKSRSPMFHFLHFPVKNRQN